MPYSIEERNKLDFYKSIVFELRNKHINEIKDSIPKNFRDGQDVLQSFEDIVSTEGLENANFEDGGALYENTLFNPNIESTTNEEQLQYYDGIRNSNLTLQDKKLKKYTKSELLNNTVNRTFTQLDIETESELPSPVVSGSLLDDVETIEETFEVTNGDVITLGVSEDMLIWLIEDNKKRAFVNKEDFFNSRYSDTPIKELPLDFIKSIDDGKLIILESVSPYVGTVTAGTDSTTENDSSAKTPYQKSGDEV